MKDKEFLQWIHDRLEFVHKENHNCDYMHKLRNIILNYPENKITPNVCKFEAVKQREFDYAQWLIAQEKSC